MKISLRGKQPILGSECFISPTSVLVGQVSAGDQSTFWFNTVVRGDVSPIEIGDRVNIQDGTIIHGTYERYTVKIGNDVSIGHSCLIHGCEIKDSCLIGMGSTLMDGVVIGENSLVAAGSLVTAGKEFEAGSLIMGRPAKRVGAVSQEQIELIKQTAIHYIKYKDWYKNSEVLDD